MAYSAYCDTATHTKWWITGTGTAKNTLSEVMDDNPSGVEEDDNPGNYQPWTEFMTETVEDGIYLIHQSLEIGDGSTSTTLLSENETVRFDDGIYYTQKSNTTVSIGSAVGSGSQNGSYWSIGHTANVDIVESGTNQVFGMYGSHLHNRANYRLNWNDGTVTIKNSVLSNVNPNDTGRYMLFSPGIESLTIDFTIFYNCRSVQIVEQGATLDNIKINNCSNSIQIANTATWPIENITIQDSVLKDVLASRAGAQAINLINPKFTPSTALIQILHDDSIVREIYSCSFNITDKDGVAISGANILIEDTAGNTVSSVDSGSNTRETVTIAETDIDVTDVENFTNGQTIQIAYEFMTVDSGATGSGDGTLTVTRASYSTPTDGYEENITLGGESIFIAQTLTTDGSGDANCYIPYRQWFGTSENQTTYSPHKITISKAGYETLILENITIDSLIDWHLELQDSHPVVGELLFDTDANPHLLIAEQIITDVC